MQVNQSTSPNFKQLRIKRSPELVEVLKNSRPETLKNIQEAGNILKDTKFFDVVLKCFPNTSSIHTEIVSPSKAYFGNFESKIFKNVIKSGENSISLDDTYRVYRNIDEYMDNSRASYLVVTDSHKVLGLGSIKELSNIAVELDGAAIREYNKRIGASNAKDLYPRTSNALINDVLMNFGE